MQKIINSKKEFSKNKHYRDYFNYQKKIKESVELINCKELCARFGQCSFSKDNKMNDTFLSVDFLEESNKCGIEIAKRLSEATFPYYLKINQKNRKRFLSIMNKLIYILNKLEIMMGDCLYKKENTDLLCVDNFYNYSMILSLSHDFNRLKNQLKEFGVFIFDRIIVLTGESEEIFSRELNKIIDFRFEDYISISGENKKKLVVELIKKKAEEGNEIYFAYDAGDKNSNRGFSKIEQLLKEKNRKLHKFGFSKNFEKSFPSFILERAVWDYIKQYIRNTDLTKDKIKNLIKEIEQEDKFIETLSEKINIKIVKSKFAQILGRIYYSGYLRGDTYGGKDYQHYEIDDFLEFLKLR